MKLYIKLILACSLLTMINIEKIHALEEDEAAMQTKHDDPTEKKTEEETEQKEEKEKAWHEKLLDHVKNAGSTIANGAKNLASKVKSLFTSDTASLKLGLKKPPAEAEAGGGDRTLKPEHTHTEETPVSTKSMGDAFSDALSSAGKSIKETVGKAADSVKQAGTNIKESITKAYNDHKIKQQIKDLDGQMEDLAKERAEKNYSEKDDVESQNKEKEISQKYQKLKEEKKGLSKQLNKKI